MTNEEIINLYEGLVEIGQNKEFKFKAALSFQLAKNKHLLKPIYESFMETQQKLVEKYADKTDEGWLIPNEKIPSFEAELKALMMTQTYVTVDAIPTDQFEDVKLDIDLMEKILPIIKK